MIMNKIEKTEDDFIREVAEEEGLTFEEVKESVEKFKSMMDTPKKSGQKRNKAKVKSKRKMTKESRRKNR